MSEYNCREDELYHYGVLGMKWGVRRNVGKAYEVASKKMRRLNYMSDRAKIKYGKKAGFHLTDFGVAAEDKARKKSAKATAKAVDWKRSMDKEFSETNLTKLEKKYIDKGEQYLKKINAGMSSKKQSSYNNKASKYYAKSKDYANLREKLYKR